MGEKKVSYNRMLPSWCPKKIIINSLKNIVKLFHVKNNIVGIHILCYIVGRIDWTRTFSYNVFNIVSVTRFYSARFVCSRFTCLPKNFAICGKKCRLRHFLSSRLFELAASYPTTPYSKHKKNRHKAGLCVLVGATGFEPATFCSQSRRSTRLSHAPMPS